MDELVAYFTRITPGLLLITLIFFLIPGKQILARIIVLIFGFILIRDAMTPEGLWSFGVTDIAVWLRFTDNLVALYALIVLCAATSLLLLRLKNLRALVRWGDLRSPTTYFVGISVGLCVATPFLLLSLGVPADERGGAVAIGLMPTILLVAFIGNFLEELLFRGFLQSYFEKHMKSIRAAVLSGLMFAAAHIFLASTVTDLGWPLLVFVTVEGLACAFVYRKYGLISAALVHGLVIFVAGAGLV